MPEGYLFYHKLGHYTVGSPTPLVCGVTLATFDAIIAPMIRWVIQYDNYKQIYACATVKTATAFLKNTISSVLAIDEILLHFFQRTRIISIVTDISWHIGRQKHWQDFGIDKYFSDLYFQSVGNSQGPF